MAACQLSKLSRITRDENPTKFLSCVDAMAVRCVASSVVSVKVVEDEGVVRIFLGSQKMVGLTC